MKKFAHLTDAELKSFAQYFLDEYIEQKGFGSMNKTDIEILVYHLLRKTSYLNVKKLNDASLKLKIPMSKVKRLDYEAELRYGKTDEEELREKTIKCLMNAQFTTDNNHIKFAVQDQLLHNYITAKFYELNSFNDTSHNRDIISVDITFFAEFLEKFVYEFTSEDEKKKFIVNVEKARQDFSQEEADKYQKMIKQQQPSKFVVNMSYILKQIAEGTAKGIMEGAMGSANSIFTSIGKLAEFGDAILKKIEKK